MTLHSDTQPDNVRPGIIREIAEKQGNKPIIGFREMIANSLDQYEGGVGLGKEKEVLITLDKLRKKVSGEDFATGIEDKEDFKAVGAVDVTGETGKKVGDQISSYKHIHPDITGRKHLGKLTLLAMSETADVTFRSNNGTNGLILTRRGYQGWAPDIIIDTVKALDHIGMKVEISNVRESLLKPKKVIEYISNIFGLRISRGARIYVIDADTGDRIRVPVPESLDTREYKVDFMSSRIPITGNLKHVPKSKTSGNIDVYIKHIKVRTIPVGFLVNGWVNCDQLEETISRDDYSENAEFQDRLEQYLIREGFEREQELTRKPLKQQKRIEELIGDIMAKYHQLYGSASLLFGDLNTDSLVDGIVNKKQPGETDWQLYKQNQKIKRQGGDPEGDEITTVGDKHKRRKGPIIRTTSIPPKPKGPGPSVEDGGTRTAFVNKRVESEEIEGKIKPRLPLVQAKRGDNPTLFIERDPKRGHVLVLNLDRVASSIVLTSAGPKQQNILVPLFVRAIVNYELKDADIELPQYEEKCDTLLNQMWGIVEDK